MDDCPRLERLVCFPIYAASNLLNRLYRPVLAGLGLTYPQYLVMLVLWESAPRSVGTLGDKLHLDSGTLTPMLKHMEARGLVTRRRDPLDERRVLIDLTAHGSDLRSRASDVPPALIRGLEISPGKADNLREVVSDLVALLSARERVAVADAP